MADENKSGLSQDKLPKDEDEVSENDKISEKSSETAESDKDEPLKEEDELSESDKISEKLSETAKSGKDEPLKEEDELSESDKISEKSSETAESSKDEPLEDEDELSENDKISEKSSEIAESGKDESLKDEDELSESDKISEKSSETAKSGKDELSESDQISEKPSKTAKSSDDKRLKNVFARPRNAEPKHPIFSSLFARHISSRAFGPKKPKWYTPLTSAQLYLFKDIMNYVEIGRGGHFRFSDFMEALQDFDPGITRAEVVDILDSMEKNEFEELDFGKFLFLLAYRDQSQDMEDSEEIDKMLSSPVVTPRQCLILSAISYYILIASPEEIERYYIANTRRKATVLHYHMEASRLLGLTEKQMEKKQKKAMQHLGPLFAVTGSPYACPVPFIQRTKQPKPLSSKLAKEKKPISRPITPIKPKREFKEKVTYKTKDDKTFYDMHYGTLPMPMFKIPEKMRKEIRKKCTVIHKDYITRKAYEAIDEYKDRLRKATVLYNKRSLDIILKKGFPSEKEKSDFIELYERYMPLKLENVKNFSLWVKPAGFEMRHKGKQLHSDKLTFGSKIL